MAKISAQTTSEHLDLGRIEGHYGALDGYTLGFESIRRLRDLEGDRVTVALADGTILRSVTLVSSGRGGVSTLWLDVEGTDLFIDRARVLDIDADQPSRP